MILFSTTKIAQSDLMSSKIQFNLESFKKKLKDASGADLPAAFLADEVEPNQTYFIE